MIYFVFKLRRWLAISLDLNDRAKKIKKKVSAGSRLKTEELYVLLLYHCFYEDSFPGTRVNVNLQPLPDSEEVKKIAVLQFTKLGDVYTTFPLLRCLKEKYEPSELVFYTDPSYSAALQGCREIDRLVTFPVDEWRSQTRAGRFDLNLIPQWFSRQPEFDLIVNCHDSLRSALVTELNPARLTWGLRHYHQGGLRVTGTAFSLWKLIYPYLLEINGYSTAELPDRLSVPRQLMLRFGFSDRESYKFKADSQNLPADFSKDKDSIALILAGGWETKRWPTKHWQKLARNLIENGHSIHLIGGKDVTAIAARIKQEVPAVNNWTGILKLSETAALLEQVDLVVSNDTGPLHLAGWLGCPLIILSGPTRVGAGGEGEAVLLQSKLDCSGCQAESCRNDEQLKCMYDIKPDCVSLLAENFFKNGFENTLKQHQKEFLELNVYFKSAESPFSYYPYPEKYTEQQDIKKILLGWLTTAVINEINVSFHPPSGRLLGNDWLHKCLHRPEWQHDNLISAASSLQNALKDLKSNWLRHPDKINWADRQPLGPLLASMCMFAAAKKDAHSVSRAYQQEVLLLLENFLEYVIKEFANV
ncbi:MAG: glycosyltransferase family 9 protein [bacterium]